jgi:Ca2+-binding RTX toxin-like protein
MVCYMKLSLFSNMGSLMFLALAFTGTTATMIAGSSITQAWADVIEGTEGDDVLVGTPGADLIDIKGSGDVNYGDTVLGNSSGNDNIISGDGNDGNS